MSKNIGFTFLSSPESTDNGPATNSLEKAPSGNDVTGQTTPNFNTTNATVNTIMNAEWELPKHIREVNEQCSKKQLRSQRRPIRKGVVDVTGGEGMFIEYPVDDVIVTPRISNESLVQDIHRSQMEVMVESARRNAVETEISEDEEDTPWPSIRNPIADYIKEVQSMLKAVLITQLRGYVGKFATVLFESLSSVVMITISGLVIYLGKLEGCALLLAGVNIGIQVGALVLKLLLTFGPADLPEKVLSGFSEKMASAFHWLWNLFRSAPEPEEEAPQAQIGGLGAALKAATVLMLMVCTIIAQVGPGSTSVWTILGMMRNIRSIKEAPTHLSDIWSTVASFLCPSEDEKRLSDELDAHVSRIDELLLLPDTDYCDPDLVAEISALIPKITTLLKSHEKTKSNSSIAFQLERLKMLHSQLIRRRGELQEFIQMDDMPRQKPVFVTFTGPAGHGKSHLMREIYDLVNLRLARDKLITKPMERLIGSVAGGSYLPTFGNQKWLQIDEYLKSPADPWIIAINEMISEDACSISSAFTKFQRPQVEFVMASTNAHLPFVFQQQGVGAENYMNPEAQQAFWTRHNVVEVFQPNYDNARGRDDQNRATPPTLHLKLPRREPARDGREDVTRVEFRGDEITKEGLVSWIVLQWKSHRIKYQKRLAERKLLITQMSRYSAETNLGAPRVVSIFGPSGTLKSTFAKEKIMPLCGLQGRVAYITPSKELKHLEPNPLIRTYILDDVVVRHQDWYKSFYDNAYDHQLFVILDNLEIKRTQLSVGLMARVAGAANGDFGGTFALDVNDFHDEAMPRRVGIGGRLSWKGKDFVPCTGNSIAYFKGPLGFTTFALNADPVTEEQVLSLIEQTLSATTPKLEMARGHPPAEAAYMVDISLPSTLMKDFIRVQALPNDEYFVDVCQEALATFGDWNTLFAHPELREGGNWKEGARAVFETAHARRSINIRFSIGGESVAMVGHKMYGFPIDSDVICETGPDGLILRTNTYGTFMPFEVFYFDSLGEQNALLANFTTFQRVVIAAHIGGVRGSKEYVAWEYKYRRQQQVQLFIHKLRTYQQDIMKSIAAHPYLYAFATATITIAGLATFCLKKGSKLEATAEAGQTPTPAELEAACASMTKEELREFFRNYAMTFYESMDPTTKATMMVAPRPGIVQKKQAPPTIKKAVAKTSPLPSASKPKLALGARVIANSHAVHGFQGVERFAQPVSHALEQVSVAACIVSSTAGTCWGLFIGANRVLTVAHVLDSTETIGHVNETVGDENIAWNFEVEMINRAREIAILQIVDSDFQQRRDLSKCFIREKDIPLVGDAVLVLPGVCVTLVRGSVDYRAHLTETIFDPSLPRYAPKQRQFHMDYATMATPTKNGDCGSVALALNPQVSNGVICAIHNGKSHGCRGLMSAVTREDLSPIQYFAEIQSVDPLIDCDFQGVRMTAPPELFDILQRVDPQISHDIRDTDRTTALGTLKEFYVGAHKSKGQFHLTRISRHLDEEIHPNLKMPAPLSGKSPIIHAASKLAMRLDSRDIPSIGATQLAKIEGKGVSINPVQQQELVEDFAAMILGMDGVQNWRPLSVREMLNGIRDPTHPWCSLVGPVRRDTSPGFPYKQLFGIKKKADLLTDVGTPEHPEWIFSDTPAGNFARVECVDSFSSALQGATPLRIVEVHLKVETLEIEKARTGGTRAYLLESAGAFFFQKRVLGGLQGLHMANRFVHGNHHTMGINPYTEFHQLYASLKRMGSHGTDADYSRFDKTIPMFAWDIIRDGLTEVAKSIGWGYGTDQIENLFKAVFNQLSTHLYLFEGGVYETRGDMVSGCFPTNMGDSWLNDVLELYILQQLFDRRASPEEKAAALKPSRKFIDLEWIQNHVEWFTNGDDINDSFRDDVLHLFDFEGKKEVLAEVGMILTPAFKHESSYKHKLIEDMTFVGRTFEFDPEDRERRAPMGKLRRSAMCGMLHWTELETREQLMATLDSYQLELRSYPEEDYNRMARDVMQALHREGWTYSFMTWRRARLHLKAELRVDVVQCALPALEYLSEMRHPNSFPEEPYPIETRKQKAAVYTAESLASGASRMMAALRLDDERRSDLTSRDRGSPKGHGRVAASNGGLYDVGVSTETLGSEDLTPVRVEPKKVNLQSVVVVEHQSLNDGVNPPSVSMQKQENLTQAERSEPKMTLPARNLSSCPYDVIERRLTEPINTRVARMFINIFMMCNVTQDIRDLQVRGDALAEAIERTTHYRSPRLNCQVCGLETRYGNLRAHIKNEHPCVTERSPLTNSYTCKEPKCRSRVHGFDGALRHVISSHPTGGDLLADYETLRENGDQTKRFTLTKESSMTTQAQAEMDVMPADPRVAGAPVSPSSQMALGNAATATNVGVMAQNVLAPAMVSGATGVADPSDNGFLMFMEPVVPPEIGAMTGTQYDYKDLAVGGFSTVYEGTLSTRDTPSGTVVFTTRLYQTIGGTLRDWINKHKYIYGQWQYHIKISSTTNIAGSLLVSHVPQGQDVDYNNTDYWINRPSYEMPFSQGTSNYKMLLCDNLTSARNREVSEISKDPISFPGIRAAVYLDIANTFDSPMELKIIILAKPHIDFRCWDPRPDNVIGDTTELDLKTDGIYMVLDGNKGFNVRPHPTQGAGVTCTPSYLSLQKTGTAELDTTIITKINTTPQWNQEFAQNIGVGDSEPKGTKSLMILKAVSSTPVGNVDLVNLHIDRFGLGETTGLTTTNNFSGTYMGYTSTTVLDDATEGATSMYIWNGSEPNYDSWIFTQTYKTAGTKIGTVTPAFDGRRLTMDTSLGSGTSLPAGRSSLLFVAFPPPLVKAGVTVNSTPCSDFHREVLRLLEAKAWTNGAADLRVGNVVIGKMIIETTGATMRLSVTAPVGLEYSEYLLPSTVKISNYVATTPSSAFPPLLPGGFTSRVVAGKSLPKNAVVFQKIAPQPPKGPTLERLLNKIPHNLVEYEAEGKGHQRVDSQAVVQTAARCGFRVRRQPRRSHQPERRTLGSTAGLRIHRQEPCVVLAHAEALIGGMMMGLGNAMTQKKQNKWWTKEYEKNRTHESKLAALESITAGGVQAGINRNLLEQQKREQEARQALVTQTADESRKYNEDVIRGQRMQEQNSQGLERKTQGVDENTPEARAFAAEDLQGPAGEPHDRDVVLGLRADTMAGREYPAPFQTIQSYPPRFDAGPAQAINSRVVKAHTGSSPGDATFPRPKPGKPATVFQTKVQTHGPKFVGAPQENLPLSVHTQEYQLLGENGSTMDYLHPASFSGSSQTNPVEMNSAAAPYTEGMKRAR